MQMGMSGLGRMGADRVRRLMRGGRECLAHDLKADALARLANEGARGGASLEGIAGTLRKPRVVWLMVPAASVEQVQVIKELSRRLEPDDITSTEAVLTISTTSGVRKRSRHVVNAPFSTRYNFDLPEIAASDARDAFRNEARSFRLKA